MWVQAKDLRALTSLQQKHKGLLDDGVDLPMSLSKINRNIRFMDENSDFGDSDDIEKLFFGNSKHERAYQTRDDRIDCGLNFY